MTHPKRRQSKSRQNKRRKNINVENPQIASCKTTGQSHIYHRAHEHEGKLYYKGKIVLDKNKSE